MRLTAMGPFSPGPPGPLVRHLTSENRALLCVLGVIPGLCGRFAMRFIVAGQTYDLTADDIRKAVRGVMPEPFLKHIVDIDGQVFPPKQVFAAATGRDRLQYTTKDAQRVLTKLGFVCRRADRREDGTAAWVPVALDDSVELTSEERIRSLEATVGTMEAAIAGLHSRLRSLEQAS